MNWLKPKSSSARYPRWMVGKPLLITSSALASLGDAMFGYSAGVIASNQIQPSFISRMYHKDVSLAQIQAGEVDINPYLVGWFYL
jgi:hypothetical protein